MSDALDRGAGIPRGAKFFRQDGWRKVLNGTTAIDEVARVTSGDLIG